MGDSAEPVPGLGGATNSDGVTASFAARLFETLVIVALVFGLPWIPRGWMYDLCGVHDDLGASLVYGGGNLIIAVAAAAALVGLGRVRWRTLGVFRKDLGGQLIRAVWVTLCVHAVNVCQLASWLLCAGGECAGGDASAASGAAVRAERLVAASEVGDLLLLFAMAGIAEELLFRGLLLRFLQRLTGDAWIAVLASSLLFAAGHWALGDQNMFVTLWMGLVLGTAYVRCGSLLTVAAAHFLFNVSAYAVFVVTG